MRAGCCSVPLCIPSAGPGATQSRYSVDGIVFVRGTYIYNGILLSHKKEQNQAICKDVNGPRGCHRVN